MAMSGEVLSRDGQSRLQPFEQAPRPMAGYAHDYVSGHETGWHRHPRAQLLFATAGVMRITTEAALFTVPPGTGPWVPADTLHGVRMDGAVRMRALFLRADAAASGPAVATVIAVSPLLRELILTVCGEPVVWDARGPVRLVAALVLHEIGRAGTGRCHCRRAATQGWRVLPRRLSRTRPIRVTSVHSRPWPAPRCAHWRGYSEQRRE
ncbi:MAG TPA: AraC family ligand binding domain-containing protein [Rhodopila sp.]